MHVRLEFDHEKLHDLQTPIRCGEVEWCRAVIIPVIHVRLEFDHEKLHDLQMSRICGSVEWCPTVIIPGIHVRLEFDHENTKSKMDVSVPTFRPSSYGFPPRRDTVERGSEAAPSSPATRGVSTLRSDPLHAVIERAVG